LNYKYTKRAGVALLRIWMAGTVASCCRASTLRCGNPRTRSCASTAVIWRRDGRWISTSCCSSIVRFRTPMIRRLATMIPTQEKS
ncbi:hypothetical protein IW139_005935, partial [Coemansia sp. RSA 353]